MELSLLGETANHFGLEIVDTFEPLTKSDTTNSGSYVVGVETAAAQNLF